MAETFNQMVAEALAEVPLVSPEEIQQRLQQNPNTLVGRCAGSSRYCGHGIVPGATNIPLGSLTYKAYNEVPEEWRDLQLQDRSRPIITTCMHGPMGALGGKLLKDMGFTDVSFLEVGVQAWRDAGLPIEKVARA